MYLILGSGKGGAFAQRSLISLTRSRAVGLLGQRWYGDVSAFED